MSLCDTLESVFGFVASVTTVIGVLPQVWKSYRTKSVDDISMAMLINCMVCSVSWMVYGALSGSAFVFWSNVFSMFVAGVAIYQKVHYGHAGECEKGGL
jgi:MtN3 and saliva related transmembrane protein